MNEAVLLVIRASVPDVEPVEERSSNVPALVPVSTDEEESFTSELPFKTLVVCAILIPVPPVVSAFA